MKTEIEIIKANIPNGIVNVKAVGKGNGKPQYKAEIDVIVKCMEEYRMQGRYFTEDEICKIQSTAYDEGYSAGLDEAGC